MIRIKKKENCCGCEACKNICPKGAISFSPDEKGDLYPIVSDDLCVNCNLCEKVCPIITPIVNQINYNPKAYAAWNNNVDERMKSTSGGVFPLLANIILENGGYVVGVQYEDDYTVSHTVISQNEELKKICKTKYVQSSNNGVYTQIKELLEDNKTVLYSGTPCQVAGLKSFLQKEYEKLYTIELFCHGVINQIVFNRYLKSIEKHSKSKITSVEFRNKRNGWSKSATVVSLENGTEYCKSNEDEYLMGYLRYNLYIRPSCTDCKYKSFPRVADLSLGDLWGIEKLFDNHDNKGASAVIVNSEKGALLFKQIEKGLFIKEISIYFLKENNPSLVQSYRIGKYSEYFYRKFQKTDFIDLIQKIKYKDTVSSKDNNFMGKIMITKNYLLGK